MSDDLDRRLSELADDAPPASLDLAAVARGAGRRRRRTRLRTGLAAAVLVAVAVPAGLALATPDRGPDSVRPGPATDAPPVSGPDTVPYDPRTAPPAFRDREPLPSCGAYVLSNGGDGPRQPATGTVCLTEAAQAGRGAELAVSTPTVEGQPVVTYRRVLPDGRWQVFTDSTGDDWGYAGWTLVECATTSETGFPTGCGQEQRLAVVPPLDDEPCPDGDTSLADYVDFLQVGDEMYVGAGPAPTGTRLGPLALTVRCELSEGARGPREELRSGDAAFVPAGTPVRQVVGFDPAFRLAVEVDGEVRLYERNAPEQPGLGLEVFPGIAERVQAVLLLSQQDGTTELARIDEPGQLARLLSELQNAPYRPGRPLDADLFLGLLLDDGSTVRRAYDTRIGVLSPGLQLGESFVDAVNAARP